MAAMLSVAEHWWGWRLANFFMSTALMTISGQARPSRSLTPDFADSGEKLRLSINDFLTLNSTHPRPVDRTTTSRWLPS